VTPYRHVVTSGSKSVILSHIQLSYSPQIHRTEGSILKIQVHRALQSIADFRLTISDHVLPILGIQDTLKDLITALDKISAQLEKIELQQGDDVESNQAMLTRLEEMNK